MARILIMALCITGGISLAVLAAPTLVVLGLFLLVIPGLILGVMPTLFFYLAIFSTAWFALRRISPVVGSIAGLSAVGLIGVGYPMYMNLYSEASLVEAAQLDRIANEKLGRQDAVRIEFPQTGHFGSQCDELCLMLLFNDMARVVVVQPSGGKPAMSYRIQTEGCLVSPKDLKDLAIRRSLGWSTTALAETVGRAVRMRMAGDECLVSSSSGDLASDWTVIWIDNSIGAKRGNWSLLPATASSRGVEVRRANQVVGRETVTGVALLAVPLNLEPYGGGIDFTGWRWARMKKPTHEQKLDRIETLKRLTSLDLDSPRGLDVSLIRRKLDAALDHPEGPAVSFVLVGDYFELLRKEGLEVDDRNRLSRLLADDRMTDFSGYADLALKDKPVALKLRDAMLTRLGRLVKNSDKENAARLESIAARLPEGAFEQSPLLDALLEEPRERHHYPRLILRLVDRGPESAPTFVKLIDESWASKERGYGWNKDADAAISGLCQLGPEAKPVLPRLLELHDRYRKGTLTGGHTWRGMLVALGADVNQFESPGSKDMARYRDELSKAAQRCGTKR